jgi:hypothetical protein
MRFAWISESAKDVPAIDEIARLPPAFSICVLDRVIKESVDAGPKLCRDIFEVAMALELVISPVLIEGPVMGRLRKLKNAVRFCMARCGPNTMLLAAAKACAEADKLLIRLVESEPLTKASVEIVVDRRKLAPEKVLRPATVVCIPRWPRILPNTLTLPPT